MNDNKILFIYIPILLLLLIVLIHLIRSRIKIRKINSMTTDEKTFRLNSLISPFGYFYNPFRDSYHTTLDAWQKEFGYTKLYDTIAPHFNMIFDFIPIYFDYDRKTWLIEIWKGQYGINIGAEIGIYNTDRILDKKEYGTEIFKPVEDDQLFPLCLNLYYKDEKLSSICQAHWWLTAFKMGRFSNLKNICTEIHITFPTPAMLYAFTEALTNNPFAPKKIYEKGLAVEFSFDYCTTCKTNILRKALISYTQWKNHLFCQLFNWVTKPFSISMDQILYLYEYAPFVFRKLFTIHSIKQYKKSHRK